VQGGALVGRTGEALGQIVVEVGDVSGVICEIAAASHRLALDTERLTERVGRFNVGAGGAASGPVRRRAA